MAVEFRLSLVALYIYIAIEMSATPAQGLTASNASPRVETPAASHPRPRKGTPDRNHQLASFEESSYSHQTARTYAVEPLFIVSNAIIHGPENRSSTAQAGLDPQHEADVEKHTDLAEASAAGLGRALLHGGHNNPNKFPFCRNCGIVRCRSDGTLCHGHCRNLSKGSMLEWCSSNQSIAFQSNTDSSDVKNQPPDSIDDDTVVIRLRRRTSVTRRSQTADYVGEGISFPDASGYEEDYSPSYQDYRYQDYI